MPIDRITLLRGPGFISYASASIYSEADIVATLVKEYSDVVVSGFARTGRRLLNVRVEVTATPVMWLNTSVLFPYATKQIGDSIYGAVDVPLVITPRNGRPLTVLNAQITTLANLKLSHNSATFKSPVTWTGLVANNTSPASLSNFFVQGSVGTNVAQTGYDATKIFRGRYTATRNSVTLRSDTGFDVDFSLSLTPDQPDGEPTVDMRLAGFDASVSFVPAGLSEADYLALLGDSEDIGASPSVHDVTVAGPSTGFPSVLIAKTHVEPGSFVYGAERRTGQLTLTSLREVSAGSLASLHTIGAVA